MERSDAELLAATRRGEREAFGALIERYQGVVCAVTYSRTGDRALSEDVAQDTFLAAWHQLDRLREVGKLRGWLCAIARNLARKARRRAGPSAPFDDAQRTLVFEGANPFDAACAAESERVVRDALARVPETYRDALVLYYREQRSARDVARALGITEAAALQRLARGRQYLADGVTDLVEQSLRRSARPGRLLAAGVLAALPVVAPSHVAQATPYPGHPMITKLILAAAALAAAGTTAYVVHSHGAAPPAVAAPAPAPERVAAPRQHVLAHRVAALPAVRAPAPTEAAPMPAGTVPVPAPEQLPILDRSIQSRLAHGPSIGPANAPVTIAVFTDLKCPYCGKAVGALDQLIDEFPSKIRVVMRQMPVHDTAILAAEGTFAADAQGKFWDYYDQVFAHEGAELTRDQLVGYATDAGLDATAFAAALDNHTYAPALAAERQLASDLELTGTPTFVINGQRIVGMVPIEELRGYVNAALAAAPQ